MSQSSFLCAELLPFGWDVSFASAFAPHAAAGLVPARVTLLSGPLLRVITAAGEAWAETAGRLRFTAAGQAELPAVGDWVALTPVEPGGRARVQALLPRRSALARRAAGTSGASQVLAANIDTLFLMVGLDGDFNPRRLERALVLAWDSGAAPVVLLNKADVCPAVGERLAEVERLALGVPVVVVSAATGSGFGALEAWLARGRTLALLGSSGVGKSTLVNRLLGDARQATQAVRAHDDRGRHTTTRRELVMLPGGALLVDTPGVRELGLWTAAPGLEVAFGDLSALGAGCAFRDCTHTHEPRCAVHAAVREGRLPPERLASFHKLRAEQRAFEARHDPAAQALEKRRWKAIHKAQRHASRE